MDISIPSALYPVLFPERGSTRYRCAFGGRGSGKSYSFALMAAFHGFREKLLILCVREFQTSIRRSFYAEVKGAIESIPAFRNHYIIGENFIKGRNGTEFIFHGLYTNLSAIKSISGVDICIVEEAEDTDHEAWVILPPTIRKNKSEIWVIWNPRDKLSPVDRRFRACPRGDALMAEVHYRDNPWFPAVLEAERAQDRETMDPGMYAHVWEGAYMEISDAQVLAGRWRVAEFEADPSWDGPYYGADWGFSQDPTAVVRCWIVDGQGDRDRLYIDYEASAVGVELDELPELFRIVPGVDNHRIRADCSRPETISYMSRYFDIIAGDKWPGCVEDGIAFMRSFDIIIHPRCIKTIDEARTWEYKRNKAGDVLPVLVPGNDHCFDAIRYALSPLIRGRNCEIGEFMAVGDKYRW